MLRCDSHLLQLKKKVIEKQLEIITTYRGMHNYSQSTSSVTGTVFLKFEWTFFNLHVSFEHRQRDFRVPVEISLVY